MNNNIFNDLVIVKRSGQRVSFNELKIALAIKYAFDDIDNTYDEKEINKVYQEVLSFINDNYKDRKTINVEDIQDIIELILKQNKYIDVYEAFHNYRIKRTESRKAFSTKKEHKFVKVVEKINSYDKTNLEKNPVESLIDLGLTTSLEYTKSFVMDSKFLKAFEEGKIYIHDLPFSNLGYLSSTHLIFDKILDDNFFIQNLLKELNDVKKEVNGEIAIDDVDSLLKKYLIKTYKQNFVKNIEDYFYLFGFSEFINIKKMTDYILKQTTINTCLEEFPYFSINDQVNRIITSAKNNSEKDAKKKLEKIIFELLNNLNNNCLENNKKYSMSLGLDKSYEGSFITDLILNNVKNTYYLENVTIIYKFNNLDDIKDIIEICKTKNVKLANNNFSLNKEGNISYFSKGERVFDYFDNSSLGKMIVNKTSINMARLGLKYKSLSKDFYQELDEVFELTKNELALVFELIGDKKVNNYKVLFKENILDDEKLEEGQKIRKVIKNGTLNINLIGLKECALVINKENFQDVIIKILKYLNDKVSNASTSTKLNFVLSAINYETASKKFIEIDKTLYGVIEKITDKAKYEDLCLINSLNEISKISKYQKYLNGGCEVIISDDLEILKELKNSDMGLISFRKSNLS